MSSIMYRDYVLSAITIAAERQRMPERIVKSAIASTLAISAREWLKFTGQELRVLPEGVTQDAQGHLVAAAELPTAVLLSFPKISLPQEATIHEILLDGDGCELSIVKEYPATDNSAATSRAFSMNNLPMFTDNFTLNVGMQPGAVLRKIVVLYEINV